MNINQGIKCDVCDSEINLRIEVGLNEYECIRFLCPECGIPIDCDVRFGFNKGQPPNVLDTKIQNAIFIDEFKNADFSIQYSGIYFTYKDTKNPHKELLSSVKLEKNVFTPFIQSRTFFGGDNCIKFQNHIKKIYYGLNNINNFKKMNTLYYQNSTYYIKEINKIRDKKNLKLISDNDVSKFQSLYYYNIEYLNLFIKEDEFNPININITNDIKAVKEKNLEEFKKFINYLFVNNDFINSYQLRLNKLILNYIEKFRYFIPAIGVEYLADNYKSENNISAELLENYTIRTATFNDIKSLYLEGYENLIEVYSILIGLNNINHRNKFDRFNTFSDMDHYVPRQIRRHSKIQISSFTEFNTLNKGLRLYYIDGGELFNKYMPKFKSKFRNSIGHENWHYDLSSQMIIYKDNMNNEYKYSLLEYAHECYLIYVKLISVYKILMDINNQYFQFIQDDI